MQKRATKDGSKKVAAFFKRNIYYVLMVVCVIAIGAMITVAAVVNSNKGGGEVVAPPVDQKPGDPTVKPEEFVLQMPIDGASVSKVFNNEKLTWNETTGSFKTHDAVDFKAPAGTSVKAVFGGVVESVVKDDAYGTRVVIDHKNGYKTTYVLLSDSTLTAGKTVVKGDVIGKVSKQLNFERAEGEHVHIELRKGAELVDIMQFIPGDNK